ncbi:MAG: trans-aconitate 2-methyltransferase [Bosea sp.]|uniref:trans-aconitate 2-methyltransferase n=1 Tax=unclassified Bosea (in: a-proteobacteria) TaxID=2653178 RepID=UPI0009645F5C|nr:MULTISPECIES: trans-aconitate 2-methyltransferase [unclassified Bosea (in: a-proteobacteria)]MBN9457114.1 trans-aconitate 2-methyltransferase [Bosea sp. (in: a-proteobacteria)]OJV09864.1 MAG: trans-aconitate 2-methyltransferase [Bosea sp. 67-29]
MSAKVDWDADQYLRFEDERTRPSLDLLQGVRLTAPARCIDLGCGPGNSTELVAARFPQAAVTGLDSSPDMIEKARKRLPRLSFVQADLAGWAPEERYDLIFANAVLQWLPDHEALFARLAAALKPGGVLAVQMPNNLAEPSHVAMAETAAEGPWAVRFAHATEAREPLGSFSDYRRWLMEAGCTVHLWQTTYVHALADCTAIIEWFKSTALKRYLDLLPAGEREGFLASYRERIARAYPAEPDGKVLLRFPRLFIVATRRAA